MSVVLKTRREIALMREAGMQDVFSVPDTAGIERVVVGRRPKG